VPTRYAALSPTDLLFVRGPYALIDAFAESARSRATFSQ
jgi:hypothetical protein